MLDTAKSAEGWGGVVAPVVALVVTRLRRAARAYAAASVRTELERHTHQEQQHPSIQHVLKARWASVTGQPWTLARERAVLRGVGSARTGACACCVLLPAGHSAICRTTTGQDLLVSYTAGATNSRRGPTLTYMSAGVSSGELHSAGQACDIPVVSPRNSSDTDLRGRAR